MSMKAMRRGRKAQRLTKRIKRTRAQLEHARADRTVKENIHSSAMGKPVSLRKTMGEQKLEYKQKRLHNRAKRFLSR